MKSEKRIAKIALRSPLVRHVMARLDVAPWLFVPPGHFYSPIPDLDVVRRDEQRGISTRAARAAGHRPR